jgi:zinc/manganese transport system substrate-binding protein
MRLVILVMLCLWSVPALAQPLKVVASISILADLVRQVGGEDVEVTTLVGPNGDAHMFEPGPGDVAKLAGAKLLVMNGLQLEGWMTRLVESSGYKGSVLVASRDITPLVVKRGDVRMKDPHAWQDVMKGRAYVLTIELGLIEADPAHAEGYRARAAAYDKVLSGLNRWVKEQMDQVPKAKRQVITSHDAFGYFGEAYGVKFLAPRGLDTEAEPMAGELGELITQIKSGGIKALFLENMTETKTAEMLAREAGAVIGGTLYVDSLSAADGPAPTYEAMFRHNVPLLRDAMMKNQ